MAARPKLKISFEERDLGMGHFLREAAKLRKKPFVKVGVTQARGSKLHTNERGEQVKTVADIAAIHEYGAPDVGIPERSFIRSTVSKNQPKYDGHIAKLAEAIFDAHKGMTTERALGLIGQEVSSDIKNTIRSGINPPLKRATIRRKNAAKIAGAEARVRGYEGKEKLTKSQKTSLFKAQDLIDTGGESTPLIDTAQLVNSISYEVAMQGQGDARYEGEGPRTS